MTERTAFIVLAVGIILTIASLLGLSVVAITQGWLTMPDIEVATTGYTSVGWAVGVWLIALGTATFALLLRRRSHRLPVRTKRSRPTPAPAGAGRATTLSLPPGPAVPVWSRGHGRPTQYLRAVEPVRSRADAPTAVIPRCVGAAVAADIRGSAATAPMPRLAGDVPPAGQPAAAPALSEGCGAGAASPESGGGRGVARLPQSAWAAASRQQLQTLDASSKERMRQMKTAAGASGGGQNGTTNSERNR